VTERVDPAADPRLVAQLERARTLGFLGPGPVQDHVHHSLGFLPALAEVTGLVADLGAGGGVPGLPLALARPDLHLVLVDSGQRRVDFLAEAVQALELGDRVRVLGGRAELVGRGDLRGTCDAVVARGFGPPAVTAECAAPLLRVGGRLVVSEPPEVVRGRWPEDELAALGLRPGAAMGGPPRLQLLEQVVACPPAYPRRDGVPGKRPLF
jgi:16S rRNA (guanine527-N7)-methyltransferase